MEIVDTKGSFILYAFLEILYLGSAFGRLWILRRKERSRVWWMIDILFATSLILGHINFWLGMASVIEEYQLEQKGLPPQVVAMKLFSPHVLKYYYVESIFYIVQIWALKFAFLGFYGQIFQHLTSNVRLGLRVAWVISAATFILNFIIVIAWCHPISRNWSPKNSCSALQDLTSASIMYSTNAVTDIILLVIPCSVLSTLQLRRRERYAFGANFLVGMMTIVATSVRFSMIYQWITKPSSSTAVRQVSIWTSVEIVTSMVAFCLPSFRLLLRVQKSRYEYQGYSSNNTPRGYTEPRIQIDTTHDFEVESQIELNPSKGTGSITSAKAGRAGAI